jgi:hypothetical protein
MSSQGFFSRAFASRPTALTRGLGASEGASLRGSGAGDATGSGRGSPRGVAAASAFRSASSTIARATINTAVLNRTRQSLSESTRGPSAVATLRRNPSALEASSTLGRSRSRRGETSFVHASSSSCALPQCAGTSKRSCPRAMAGTQNIARSPATQGTAQTGTCKTMEGRTLQRAYQRHSAGAAVRQLSAHFAGFKSRAMVLRPMASERAACDRLCFTARSVCST